MTIFFNTFIKILATLLALSLFILILISILNFANDTDLETDFKSYEGSSSSSNKIVILKLDGPILNEPFYLNYLTEIQNINPSKVKIKLNKIKEINPKFLIVSINSPGGTVAASNELYKIFKKFKSENDIIIYFHTNETLASGGYWSALSADKIYASYGSLIGSIGVKGPDWIYFDKPISISTGILGRSIETKNGINVYSQNAGESKDLLNPFRKPKEEELKKMKMMINNIYEDFINIVSQKRKIEKQEIKDNIGAFIYNSSIAKNYYLIDGVISLDNLIKKIIKENKFNENYQIFRTSKPSFSFIDKYFMKIFYDYKIEEIILSKKIFCDKFKNNISTISTNYLANC